ncbi:hypothetical protein SOPP22_16430 [Shewanella sp. OPT22]|nr:hypothetical protein SOPP22_16430 [Shewanella sp. OPT22]
MKKYVTALDLINLANEIGNAAMHCERSLNQLPIPEKSYDIETIWPQILEIHFWDYSLEEQQGIKRVFEQLFNAAGLINGINLDENFAHDNIFDDEFC